MRPAGSGSDKGIAAPSANRIADFAELAANGRSRRPLIAPRAIVPSLNNTMVVRP
jgi:hypothetical protein